MDRIADGIEKSNGPIKVFGPDDITFLAGDFDPSFFDLEVLRNWIRRPSDNPRDMPPAAEGLSYADRGVDLTITVLFGAEGFAEQKKFFTAKGELQVEVVAIEPALELFRDELATLLARIRSTADS